MLEQNKNSPFQTQQGDQSQDQTTALKSWEKKNTEITKQPQLLPSSQSKINPRAKMIVTVQTEAERLVLQLQCHATRRCSLQRNVSFQRPENVLLINRALFLTSKTASSKRTALCCFRHTLSEAQPRGGIQAYHLVARGLTSLTYKHRAPHSPLICSESERTSANPSEGKQWVQMTVTKGTGDRHSEATRLGSVCYCTLGRTKHRACLGSPVKL